MLDRPMVKGHDRELIELGHECYTAGKRQICIKCGDCWSKSQRGRVIAAGQCKRHIPWTSIPRSLDSPWKLPRENTIRYRGSIIHRSHSLVYYRGVLYCSLCGNMAVTKVDLLTKGCLLKPKNAAAYYRLKNFKQGKYLSGQQWPLALDFQTPMGLVPFLEYDRVAHGNWAFNPGRIPYHPM